jgi:hypothetical protein
MGARSPAQGALIHMLKCYDRLLSVMSSETALSIAVVFLIVSASCGPTENPSGQAEELITRAKRGQSSIQELSEGLMVIGDEAILPVASNLAAADRASLAVFTMFLMQADERKVKTALSPLLESTDPIERSRVLAILAVRLEKGEKVQVVRSMLNDPEKVVRLTALQAGLDIDDPALDKVYKDGLQSSDLEERLICSWKAAKAGDYQGLRTVQDSLRSENEEIVYLAIDAIQAFPAQIAIRELSQLRSTASPTQRELIDSTVSSLQDKRQSVK